MTVTSAPLFWNKISILKGMGCLNSPNSFIWEGVDGPHTAAKKPLTYLSVILQLAMVFRTWARICKLDRPQDGSLVAHTYVLMSIYFLQQNNYISVLDEVIIKIIILFCTDYNLQTLQKIIKLPYCTGCSKHFFNLNLHYSNRSTM